MPALLRWAKTLLLRAVAGYTKHRAPHNAAAICYYVLFSLFPLIIFVIGAAGLVLGSDSSVRREIVDVLVQEAAFSEGEGRGQVRDAVEGVHGTGGGLAGLAGLAGFAWSASAMFGAIRRALNAAFGDDAAERPLVQQKAIDLALVLALATAFLLSLAAGAALRFVANSTESLAGWGDAADEAGLLWDAASYLVPLLLAFGAFLALYSLVPSRVHRPSELWPGALAGAVLFATANLLFSFYLENFSNYNVVFGSLGAVAAFLFWLYLSANIMLFGAEIAASYPHLLAEPVEQPSLEGMALPFPQRLRGVVRRLFVREGEPVEHIGEKARRSRT